MNWSSSREVRRFVFGVLTRDLIDNRDQFDGFPASSLF